MIAYGASVGNALLAADQLEKQGIKSTVLDMAFIKPIDQEAIIEHCQESGLVLTIEEQTILGGLGSAVAEVIAENKLDVRLKRIGIPDVYTLAGPYPDLQAHYSLDAKGIVKKALALLNGK
jgi:transketolase